MQRNVPQFIEIEDKIFGPFTLKQFAYLAGGAGLSVVIWRTVPLSIGLFLIAPVMGFSIAMAFAKFNSKPFLEIVRAAIYYFFSGKMFLWQNPTTKEQVRRQEQQVQNAKDAQKTFDNRVQSKTFSKNDIQDLASRLNQK